MAADQCTGDVLYQFCNAGSILDEWFCLFSDINIVILWLIDHAGLPDILLADVGRGRKGEVSEIKDRSFAFAFINTAWLRVFQIMVGDYLDGCETSVVLDKRGASCDGIGGVNDNPDFVVWVTFGKNGFHLPGLISVVHDVRRAGDDLYGVVV